MLGSWASAAATTAAGSSYRPLAQIRAGNGYWADLHDIQITPQGSAFITAYSLVHTDLSSAGGSRDGTLLDAIVQEVDIKTGLVMFEWHAYGHVALSDSYAHPPYDPAQPWDFFHLNSISLDPWGDGNFIVSSRNTWAAYEINQLSGAWAVSARASRWDPVPARPTSTTCAGSPITRSRSSTKGRSLAHSQSRVIRGQIDWAHRKMTLLSRYVRTPTLLSGS